MLRNLEQIEPSNLAESVAPVGSSDAQNLITDLIEVAKRLELLDLLRDFEATYKPEMPTRAEVES